MKHALPLILLTLNVIGSANAADSRRAEVYHCGPLGRDLRDSPCPEAPTKSPSSIAYSEPDAAERGAALERADADADQAAALEWQRLANERQARRSVAPASSLNAVPDPMPEPEVGEPQLIHPKAPRPIKRVGTPKPAKAATPSMPSIPSIPPVPPKEPHRSRADSAPHQGASSHGSAP